MGRAASMHAGPAGAIRRPCMRGAPAPGRMDQAFGRAPTHVYSACLLSSLQGSSYLLPMYLHWHVHPLPPWICRRRDRGRPRSCLYRPGAARQVRPGHVLQAVCVPACAHAAHVCRPGVSMLRRLAGRRGNPPHRFLIKPPCCAGAASRGDIGSEVFFKSVPVLRATIEKRIPIDKFIICLDLNQIAFMFQVCRFTLRNAQ